MHCPHCGHRPPAESLFCNMCGEKLPADEQGRSYTPPHLVEKVLSMRSALEGERKQVTVMFADVKGSVALSETLDAEAWHQVMDRFFAIVTAGIHDFEGTINQYTGDGIMALFGAPIAHEDHARRACLAALRIQRELHALAAELEEEYGVEFLVRIGMNSGEVVVGKIGDDLRMDYTAQGHTVGLAARMESTARPGSIYLTQFTRALVEGLFEMRDRGDLRVKGIGKRVKVYELRRAARYRSRFEVAREQGLPPLIGRRSELEILNKALARARQGQGQVIAITGDPGVGKSRLLYEFARHCREQDMVVAETRGVPYHKAVPVAAISHFLKSYFRIDEDDETEQAREKVSNLLGSMNPDLVGQADQIMELLGLADAGAGQGGAQTRLDSLEQTFLAMIDAASQRDTGLVLIDNLHWIDSQVMAGFLDYMMHSIAGSRVLAVVTYRPEYQCRWHELEHFRELRLQPFTAEEGGEYLDALLGGDKSLQGLKKQIVERTGGNPLFMEQVVRSLIDTGDLEKTKGGYRLDKPIKKLQVPAEIQALVAARIDRLAQQDKHLLQVASVIGKQFPVELLQQVSGLSTAEVSASLERLTASGWIYRCSIEAGEGKVEYAFHQSLLRDVAYLGQLAENRATVHRAVAASLAESDTPSADGYEALVAEHYAKAGDLETAVQWHARAAHWAAPRDLSMAMQHWRSVSSLVEELPDSPGSTAVALQACARLIYLGARYGMSQEDMAALIEQGEELCAKAEELELCCLYLLACATAYLFNADNKACADALDRAQALAGDKAGIGMRASLCMVRAYLYLQMGELWQVESVTATGLGLLNGDENSGRDLLGRSPYVSLLCLKAWVSVYQGKLKQAAELVLEIREISERREEPENSVLCEIVDSLLQAENGHPRKAIERAKAGLEVAERQRHNNLRVTSLWILAQAYVVAENGRRAAETVAQARRLIEERHVALHVEARLLLTEGRALGLLDEPDKARATLREAVRMARKQGQKYLLASVDLALAEHLLETQKGRRVETEALNLLKQSESVIEEIGADALWPRWHMASHQLARIRGDNERADREWQAASRLLKQVGATAQLRRLRAALRKRAKD